MSLWLLHLRSLFCSRCALLMSSVGSSSAIVTAAASTCLVPDLRSVLITCFQSLFPLWAVSQLFTKSAPLESECLGERREILPMTETTEEEVTVVTVEKVALPWRRFIREMADRHSWWCSSVGWCGACVVDDGDRKRNDVQFTQSASGWAPSWRAFGGQLSRRPGLGPPTELFLWPIDANAWIVVNPDGDKYAVKFSDYSKMRVPPLVLSMSWVSWSEKEEIWPSVRGPQWDWPTTLTRRWCVIWVDAFSTYLLRLDERVRRRIVRKWPMWRPAPANPPTPD